MEITEVKDYQVQPEEYNEEYTISALVRNHRLCAEAPTTQAATMRLKKDDVISNAISVVDVDQSGLIR